MSRTIIGETDPKKAPAVDLITHWYGAAPCGKYRIGETDLWLETVFELTDSNRVQVWINVLRPLYVLDAKTKGQTLLSALDAAYPIDSILAQFTPEYRRLRLTGITDAMIAAARSAGWLVGSHSRSHYQLSALDQSEQEIEITQAQDDFKSVVFSYPYGNRDAVSDETMEMVKKAGPRRSIEYAKCRGNA